VGLSYSLSHQPSLKENFGLLSGFCVFAFFCRSLSLLRLHERKGGSSVYKREAWQLLLT
jgi:hypothetical protein